MLCFFQKSNTNTYALVFENITYNIDHNYSVCLSSRVLIIEIQTHFFP